MSAGHPLDDGYGLISHRELKRLHCILEISLRSEGRGVEFLESFRDAFGLRAGEASGFEFLDDAVGVDHQCLHISSVYQLTATLQGFEFCTEEE